MSSGREGKKSRKIASKPNSLSLQEKIKMVEEEEQALVKNIDHLQKWTERIDAMNDEQLKEYLKNRPEELKSVKIQKTKPKQKVQKIVKPKPTSACSGIMASVWKFHKEDDEDKDLNMK